MIFHNPPEKSH